jgi:hypothetical protein
MRTLHDAIPPLTLILASGLLTFARYRVAPLIWQLMNNVPRYGVLGLACVLSLLYVAVFAPGPLAEKLAASEETLELASLGLLGLAAGFFIIAVVLLIPRRNEDGQQ